MLEPVGFRVIILPDAIESLGEASDDGTITTEGGIVLNAKSDVVKDHIREKGGTVIGTVVSVGPTAWKGFDDGKAWAEIGDRVYYAKYCGKWVTDPDDTTKEYLVVNDEDIICKIRGE